MIKSSSVVFFLDPGQPLGRGHLALGAIHRCDDRRVDLVGDEQDADDTAGGGEARPG